MDSAEHEHDDTDLATDRFEYLANICGSDALLQRHRDVADIDKAKTDDKEMIDQSSSRSLPRKESIRKTRPFLCSVCAAQIVSGMLSAM